MITLSLLKLLEDNGFGVIDKTLFFQKMALDCVGVYVANISDMQTRGMRRSQGFELYSRGENDVDGYKKLNDIIEFLNNTPGICRLPAVPPTTSRAFENVTITTISSINTVGQDENGRIIYSATGVINY